MDKILAMIKEELDAAQRRYHRLKTKFFAELYKTYEEGGIDKAKQFVDLEEGKIGARADVSAYEMREAIFAARKILKKHKQ